MVSPRYSSLFYGLKKHTPRNASVVQPLAFILRRLIYACAICMIPAKLSYIGILAISATCILMGAFVISEKPWRHEERNRQYLVNEILLYVIIMMSMLFTHRAVHGKAADILGWVMIGVIFVFIAYNFLEMVLECLKKTALLYKRF